jgi:nickel-dependent lactate racemase
MIQQDATTYGRIADNPFHQAAVDIARMAGADFITNVTLDDAHRVTGVFSGELVQAHETACRFLDTYVVQDIPGPADIVLTTGGGAPLDATLYQSLKGLVTALKGVKKGGTVILAAENREGMGSPEFTELMHRLNKPEEFFELSRQRNYIAKDQWMLQELMNGLHHVDVICCSGGLTEEQIKDCFMTPAATVQAGVESALKRHGPDARIIVLPDGPYVLPRTTQGIEKLYSWFEMM